MMLLYLHLHFQIKYAQMCKRILFILVFSTIITRVSSQDLLSLKKVKNDEDLLKSTVWIKGISKATKRLKYIRITKAKKSSG